MKSTNNTMTKEPTLGMETSLISPKGTPIVMAVASAHLLLQLISCKPFLMWQGRKTRVMGLALEDRRSSQSTKTRTLGLAPIKSPQILPTSTRA
jgi:hypothetical protein